MAHSPILQLKRAYLSTRQAMDHELLAYGLTSAQLDILLYLWERDGQEQRMLQVCLGITSGTLTGLVDSLVKVGVVERRLSVEDARVKHLYLTPKGQSLRDEMEDMAHKFFARFFEGFSQTEAALLAEWLGRIAANMGDESNDVCS